MSHARSLQFGRIATRMSLAVATATAVLILFGTLFLSLLSYQEACQAIARQEQLIQDCFVPAVAGSAYELDVEGAERQLAGIRQLRGVLSARIEGLPDRAYLPEASAADAELVWRYPLVMAKVVGPAVDCGVLVVEAGYASARAEIIDSILRSLPVSAVAGLTIAVLILFLVQRLITRHLAHMAAQIAGVRLDALGAPLTLARRDPTWFRPDELDVLVTGWNRMRERLERQLSERQALHHRMAQEQKLEALGLLAGGIAHDTNNMLAALMGSADLMALRLRTLGDAQVLGHLQVIQETCERMRDLNQSLLAFARKGQGVARDFDVHTSLQRCERLLARKLGRGIDLALDLRALRTAARGDPSQLESAVINLVVNARDALAGRPGTITISTRDAADHQHAVRGILVSVRDTGDGIPDEILPHIFEPFFTTKGEGKGTGLGLAGVAAAAAAMGGEVEVATHLGAGTTFTLRLPSHRPGADTGLIVPVGAADPRPGLRILVVDDDDEVRHSLVRMLAAHTTKVVDVASDGQAGVTAAAAATYDLVFMDIFMPKLDGLHAAAEIARRTPDIDLVIMTGDIGSLDPGTLPGRPQLLGKPFVAAEVAAVLAKVVVRAR